MVGFDRAAQFTGVNEQCSAEPFAVSVHKINSEAASGAAVRFITSLQTIENTDA